MADIADDVGITLGSGQRILAGLVDAGYVNRERDGRRIRYAINRGAPMLRHIAHHGHDIGGLLDLLRLEDHDQVPADTSLPAIAGASSRVRRRGTQPTRAGTPNDAQAARSRGSSSADEPIVSSRETAARKRREMCIWE